MAARSATCVVECMERSGGLIAQEGPRRLPRRSSASRSAASYRGFEILGPPPPASSGVHITQMLNILEGYDVAQARLRHGRRRAPAGRGAEDRLRRPRRRRPPTRPSSTVPVERLTSKAYADERRARHRHARAQSTGAAGLAASEGADTTHLTVADGDGNVVATTQTINSLFGARVIGARHRHDPEQLHVQLRPASGQRAVDRAGQAGHHLDGADDGAARRQAGLCARPAGRARIFPSAMQALINLIDHGMSLQEAVEAPRIWTEGDVLEVEHGVPETVRAGPARRAATTSCSMPTRGRRHERHPVPRRRHA